MTHITMKLLSKSLSVQNWKISENNRHVTTAFGCKFTITDVLVKQWENPQKTIF